MEGNENSEVKMQQRRAREKFHVWLAREKEMHTHSKELY